jgi:pSer/pThr/pTyr-binding forkhead associated (FHA) protein
LINSATRFATDDPLRHNPVVNFISRIMVMTEPLKQPDQWHLLLYADTDKPQTTSLAAAKVRIGREADNDIVLDDVQVSRYHLVLTRQDEQLFVEDLNTANGTLVNGEPLTEPSPLQPGDTIKIGQVTIRVERRSPAPPAPVEPEAAPVPVTAAPSRRGLFWLVGIGGLILLLLLLLGGGLLFWRLRASASRPAVAEASTPESLTLDVPQVTIVEGPASNSTLPVNQSVTIQAVASDPTGVARLELWVNNRKVDEVASQLAQNVHSMSVGFQWSSRMPGTYTLQVRAYNQQELAGFAPVATLTVVGDTPTPTPEPSPTITSTPTPTVTPPPPSPTPTFNPTPTTPPSPSPTPTPTVPSLILNVPALSVRAGPGLQYEVIGQVDRQNPPEIVGQVNLGQGTWFQIRYAGSPTGLGWVSGDASFSAAPALAAVPQVNPTVLPPTITPTPTSTPSSTPSPTATATSRPILRAPEDKTLLIVGNRSYANGTARLTLSGGKSVGGGLEIDPPPNGEIQLVLEPDYYHAVWSASWRGFARSVDFTAVPGKIMVMWIIPEEGHTMTEVYDELVLGNAPTVTPTATPMPVPEIATGPVAPEGKALLIVGNRSLANEHAVLTLTGGNFGGGEQFIVNSNTEIFLELLPADYRTIWTSPARGGFTAGREFSVTAGEVIFVWVIPEDKKVFMQFPGQPPFQSNN